MDKLLEYLFFLIEKIDWILKPIKSTNDDEIDSYLNSEKNSIRFLILSIFLMVAELSISTKDDVKAQSLINIVNPIINYIKTGLVIVSLISLVTSLVYAIRWLYLRWKLDINS